MDDRIDAVSRRILVAVDESDASRRVADFVNTFFDGLGMEITAINVGRGPWIAAPYPPAGVAFGWGLAATSPAAYPIEGDTEVQLEAGDRVIDRSGIHDTDRIIDIGDPVELITQAAVERDVDLIVVGSNHKGLLDRLLSGSVSTELVRSAPRPVLVVH